LKDEKKRPVEKNLEGGRRVLRGTILLVVGRVRETSLETAQPASNRDSNRELLNTIVAPTAYYVTNIILQQQINTKIKGENFFSFKTLSLI
jgi:hypothetical protein